MVKSPSQRHGLTAPLLPNGGSGGGAIDHHHHHHQTSPTAVAAGHEEDDCCNQAEDDGYGPGRVLDLTEGDDTVVLDADGNQQHRWLAFVTGAADETEIKLFLGYHSPLWKRAIYYILGILTAGTIFLMAKWWPRMYILLTLSRCPLKKAQYVLIKLVDGRSDLERVQRLPALPGAPASQPPGSTTLVVSEEEEESGKAKLLGPQSPGHHLLLEYRCARYLFVEGLDTFVAVPGVPKGFAGQLQRVAGQLAAGGRASMLEEQEQGWGLADRQMRYGSNDMRIPVRSIASLVYAEMWHPFYVFQYASILIWVLGDQYYSYSICIALITWFSIVSSAVETHQNAKRLAQIACFTCDVEVLRDGRFRVLSSSQLVPGDIIVVQPGTLPCDCVLLRGECIVDENMLTGESVPVRKVCYSPSADGLSYSPDKSTACTLFGGTHVAQARAPRNQKAVAMVVRTRFYSAKGQLLRSILFPREHAEAFVSDSMFFIAFMLAGCMALYVWAAVVLASVGASPTRIVVRFFDMITIAVPPALPACLTIATVFSIDRLRKRDVFVTSPDRITMAGRLDVICFDKTGTLTEQGLDLQGLVPVEGGCFQPMVSDSTQLPTLVLELLASCHGLARMGEALVGDPLDQKLFLATGWELIDDRSAAEQGARTSDSGSLLEDQHGDDDDVHVDDHASHVHTYVRPPPAPENASLEADSLATPLMGAAGDAGVPPASQRQALPHQLAYAYALIKRFEFNAALQRNVVVVRAPDGSRAVFAKGSPEVIRSLVQADSVPPDFDAVLGEYTREGLRVLALAHGDASQVPEPDLQSWRQDELEGRVPLRLLGLAVMANPLRSDTADVIRHLEGSGIRTVMVTGDHLRTAISVAHLCHIMPDHKPICLVDCIPAPSSSATATPPNPGSPYTTAAASAALALASALADEQQRRAQGGSSAAGGLMMAGGLKLSILQPDGSIEAVEAPSAVLARVMSGELECAVTGKGFTRLVEYADNECERPLLLACLQRASVFARMSPDNKRDLCELMGSGLTGLPGCPHLGLHVGFCGDGANDCGALKAAHVGVSLCEAEASVAAPMTSKHQSIASMVAVIAEGRCTLMATYQIFQFIIGYALVQAFETNLMYTFALNVGNYQYLVQDLFFTTVLAALMGSTRPRARLSRSKPLSRVMSAPLLLSTLLQLAVVVAFQLAALLLLRAQPGYVPSQGPPDLRQAQAPENTTTYVVSLGQFIILALVFNKGRPHRKPLHTNWGLLVAVLAQTCFVCYSLFIVDAFNLEVQQLVGLDGVVTYRFRALLLALLAANGVAAITVEYLAQGVVGLGRRLLARTRTR